MADYRYFRSHALRVPTNHRSLQVSQMLTAEKLRSDSKKIHPTLGAFIHYGGVELADRLAILMPPADDQEMADLRAAWNNSCGRVARQLTYYVWHIINREMRHGKKSQAQKAWSVPNKIPDYARQAVEAVNAAGSNYMQVVSSHAGSMPLGDYVDALEQHYRHGGWGGGFGGPAWADIALEFKRFVDGETSCMVACDRHWTLCHNNGPIFNKPVHFTTYDAKLIQVLNAQHSSSVFDLSSQILDNSSYDHPVMTAFATFTHLAVDLIKRVQPDYELGSTGAVTSDGKKPDGAAAGFKSPKGTHSIGPFSYKPGQREAAQ